MGDDSDSLDLSGLGGEEPAVSSTASTTAPQTLTEKLEPSIIIHPLDSDATPVIQKPDLMSEVKDYSDHLPVGKPSVHAALPFSLLIEGSLKPSEREKLLDLISRHEMDIRELDLEPQFEEGRVLIPRISEYAGILLIQALRGADVQMKFGPSDSIFATESTRDEFAHAGIFAPELKLETSMSSPASAAEYLPISSDTSAVGGSYSTVLDVVTASALLKTSAVEAEHSVEYLEALEALKRELKYKAHHKGAQALVHFTVNLTQLSHPMQYRLTAVASAVKTQQSSDLTSV